MTIYCVGRNSAAHAREMGARPAAAGEEPVVFLKPTSAWVAAPGPIVVPAGIGELHHEAELVLRIGPGGQPDALALGLDLTDRARQAAAKQAGLPWAAAKGFRGSAAVGPWVPLAAAPPLDRLRFTLHVDGVLRQQGDTRDMLHPVPRLLAWLQRWFGLCAGDLVFTGTPEGVGPLQAGASLRLDLEGVPAARATFTYAGPQEA